VRERGQVLDQLVLFEHDGSSLVLVLGEIYELALSVSEHLVVVINNTVLGLLAALHEHTKSPSEVSLEKHGKNGHNAENE
jgi:hypothetical protein